MVVNFDDEGNYFFGEELAHTPRKKNITHVELLTLHRQNQTNKTNFQLKNQEKIFRSLLFSDVSDYDNAIDMSEKSEELTLDGIKCESHED